MIWLLGYVLSIVAANATLAVVGFVPVGFGLMAPAGVLWAGLALTLRDLVQDRLGRVAVLAAIAAGGLLSLLVAPSFAIASAGAFFVSELADMAVYTPLRRRHWLSAIVASNTVGLVVDSALFLWLAFGSLDFLAGQIVGKGYVTAATVALLWWGRRRRRASMATA